MSPPEAPDTGDERLDRVKNLIVLELRRVIRRYTDGGLYVLPGRKRAWRQGVNASHEVEARCLWAMLEVIYGQRVHECDDGAITPTDVECARCGWLPGGAP